MPPTIYGTLSSVLRPVAPKYHVKTSVLPVCCLFLCGAAPRLFWIVPSVFRWCSTAVFVCHVFLFAVRVGPLLSPSCSACVWCCCVCVPNCYLIHHYCSICVQNFIVQRFTIQHFTAHHFTLLYFFCNMLPYSNSCTFDCTALFCILVWLASDTWRSVGSSGVKRRGGVLDTRGCTRPSAYVKMNDIYNYYHHHLKRYADDQLLEGPRRALVIIIIVTIMVTWEQ